LTSAQEAWVRPAATPALIAREDWVRERARRVPLRTPEQLRQLQFHCGKPPPAADPRTLIFNGFDSNRAQPARGADWPAAAF
jgi:hypothetical protein